MSLIPTSFRDSFWDDEPHFSSSSYSSSTRGDFDDMRRRMQRETDDFWGRDNSSNRSWDWDDPVRRDPVVDEILSKYKLRDRDPTINMDSTSSRWLSPRLDSYSSSALATSSRGTDVKEDDTKFEITVDVRNFRPEDLRVITNPDHTIVIEGRHEDKNSNMPPEGLRKDQTGNFYHKAVQNHFRKQYTLPSECDLLRVYSNMSRDGSLVVTAPKRAATAAVKDVPSTSSSTTPSSRFIRTEMPKYERYVEMPPTTRRYERRYKTTASSDLPTTSKYERKVPISSGKY